RDPAPRFLTPTRGASQRAFVLGLSAAALIAALALYYGRWRRLEATLDPSEVSGTATSAADRRTIIPPKNTPPVVTARTATLAGTRIARAAWGSKQGELGRRGGDES